MGGLAAVTWKDLLEKRYEHLPEEKKALITKLICKRSKVFTISSYNL